MKNPVFSLKLIGNSVYGFGTQQLPKNKVGANLRAPWEILNIIWSNPEIFFVETNQAGGCDYWKPIADVQ